jgi:hypothetical protein
VSFASLPNPADPDPSITVNNDFVAGSWAPYFYPWPDIRVVGDVDNLGGDVLLKTLPAGDGDIIIEARVRAKQLTILAGGTLYVDGVSDFAVGGEPYAKYNEATTGTISATIDPDGVPGSGDEYSISSEYRGIAAATEEEANAVADAPFAEAATVYADKIFINAEYININGLIQSGKADYNLTLGGAIAAEIAGLNPAQTQTAVLSPSFGIDPDGIPNSGDEYGDFIVKFDPVKDQIIIDEMRVSGGLIELTGHILNTGAGEIRVLGGYGNINVVNTTPYDLVLNRLDASQRGAGTLVIIDKAKGGISNPTATIYRSSGDGIIRTRG